MVIQRSWKTSSQSGEHVNPTSSSEDSNSSWQTLSNSTASGYTNRNVLTRSVSLANPEMAESVLRALKNRYHGRYSIHQTNSEWADQSLELMRENIQDLFDKEVDAIVRRFIETYFQSAMTNIKENICNTISTDDCLKKVSRQLLENAKRQYLPEVITVKTEPIFIKSEPMDDNVYAFESPSLKRKESPTSSDTNESIEEPKRVAINPPPSVPIQKPVTWNVANVVADTLFVLDHKANRALGYLDNFKEHLSNDNPDLIRYVADVQDKEWLVSNRILTPNFKNLRISMMVMGEVCKVAQSPEYRSRPNLKLTELVGFKVSEVMLQKMRVMFSEKFRASPQSEVNVSEGSNSSGSEMHSTDSEAKKGSSRSSLSSSHATLSALLAPSSEANATMSPNSTPSSTTAISPDNSTR